MKPKLLFLFIAILGLVLGVLPEFISDEMKAKVKGAFGDYYGAIWLTIFVIGAALFIYLTWKQTQLEKNSTANTSSASLQPKSTTTLKIQQHHTGKGDNIAGDKILNR